MEAMDKAGNFIGWLFIDSTNLSVALVEVRFRTWDSSFFHSSGIETFCSQCQMTSVNSIMYKYSENSPFGFPIKLRYKGL